MKSANQSRLQSLVEAHASGHLLSEFLWFHLSVAQKLWSVDYFGDEIAGLQPAVFYEQLTQANTSRVQQSTDKKSFGLHSNLLLDGFLMNAMAVLDTLAHEIRVLYSFQGVQSKTPSKPDRVYIGTVKDDLVKYHSGKHLTKYLSSELTKPWFGTFSRYRHCTTHESLIGSNVHLDVSAITGDLRQAVVPLPDDPKKRPFTYKSNRELKSYCEKTRDNIKQMASRSYYLIGKDMRLSKSVLPIP